MKKRFSLIDSRIKNVNMFRISTQNISLVRLEICLCILLIPSLKLVLQNKLSNAPCLNVLIKVEELENIMFLLYVYNMFSFIILHMNTPKNIRRVFNEIWKFDEK